MDIDAKVKELTDKLEQGLKDLFDSDNFKNYLNVMSKFHNYSVNNTLLIMQQSPEATRVASYNSWEKNFNRHVKKGEKGIKIIAPAPYKMTVDKYVMDENGNPVLDEKGQPKTEPKEIKVPVYKVVNVFDVSQTDGEPLPTLGVSELIGGVEGAKLFIDTLKNISPVPVEFKDTGSDAKGFFSVTENAIVIQPGMSDSQTIKTMIHEISHAKLHNPDALKERDSETQIKSRGTLEVEAESIAYTVCQHFGIDTSDYSFGYIAGWSENKEMEELKGSINTIRAASCELINRIEGGIRAVELQRESLIDHVEEEIKGPNETKTNEMLAKEVVSVGSNDISGKETEKKSELKEKENAEPKKQKSLKAKLNEKKAEVEKKKASVSSKTPKKGKEIE